MVSGGYQRISLYVGTNVCMMLLEKESAVWISARLSFQWRSCDGSMGGLIYWWYIWVVFALTAGSKPRKQRWKQRWASFAFVQWALLTIGNLLMTFPC